MKDTHYPRIDLAETGLNIKRLIWQKGLSVKEVQKYLELNTPQSIYHWFDGRNLPTIDNLYALSELLEVSMDTLIVGNRKNNRIRKGTQFGRIWSYYLMLSA